MRQKLRRFAENKERWNVLEPGKERYDDIKGNWRSDFFKNENDIVLELGCGKGEYTIGLAQQYPDKNFIGVDIKGDRIWVGSKNALELELSNAGFLRTQIQFLDRFFEAEEVSEIWLTFPDPRPRDRDEKRRLSSPNYLELYRSILKRNGWFRMKTDNTPLFDYTLDVLENHFKTKEFVHTHDLYNSELNGEHFGIKTKYEKKFFELGEKIKYLKFKFC